jgi:hypothetical protein
MLGVLKNFYQFIESLTQNHEFCHIKQFNKLDLLD